MSVSPPTLSSAVSEMWVYVAGEVNDGKVIKIGSTKAATVATRLQNVNGDMSVLGERFVLLAAMRSEPRAEKNLHNYFAAFRLDRGNRTEYFRADPALVEYVLWLRAQYCTSVTATDAEELLAAEDINYWLPRPERRIAPPPEEPDVLFARHIQLQGELAGTAWDWMPDPLASYNDYFTPPELVARAERAMSGIDLDPASHFEANKRFIQAGIRIGRYFTRAHNAFDNEWNGNIWLNPPYGDYRPWFERITEQIAAGHVGQVCMISPMWAFGTKLARPHVDAAAAMCVLRPTPQFYNPSDPTKTGRNDPHAVVYWGDRVGAFYDAFDDAGIFCHLVYREAR